MSRTRTWAGLALMVLGAGTAACSGTKAPTVASLGAVTTTTASPGSGGSGGGASGLAQADKYAQCMRSHGVPGFPDPTTGPGGSLGFKIEGNKLGASPSQMNKAQGDCKSLAPNGGTPRQLTAAQQQAFLNWAACIRTHGFPQFPDPDFSGGGVRISLAGGAGLGNGAGPSPEFQAAQKACQSKLPSGFGAGL